MRLKEIELKGFKSFLNKTKIEFNNEITSVVGPNGSGKSNISDAVRWVLGEQSIKTLRGSKMEDVIFAGTNNRKALGFAEVTITFDNKSGLIPIDYDEVAITRRVFRSGESEYFLNKNACRLKDIRELLMDTGIGKEGYSIIGQGRIGEILSNNPAERRGIFEEAAGIIKYKSKKEEAEKKLAKTDDNLLRINDLYSELKQQETSLKKQAEKALKYRENYDKLRSLEVNLLAKTIADLREEAGRLLGIEKDLGQKEKTQALELDQEEKNLDQLRQELELKQGAYQDLREKNNQSLRELDQLEHEIKLLAETIKFRQAELARLETEEIEISKGLENLQEEIQKTGQAILDKQKLLSQIKDQLEGENQEALSLLGSIKALEDEVEANKDATIKIYNRISEKRSELNSVNALAENMDQRARQLNKYIENEQANIDQELESSQLLSKNLGQKTEEILRLNQAREDLDKKKQAGQASVVQLEKQMNELSLKIQGEKSSYNVYKKMEETYEGYYKGVKTILNIAKQDQTIGQGILGLVAELIQLKPRDEVAITTALGASAQFIVTKNQEAARLIINKLYDVKGGRVTCLPMDKIKGSPLVLNEKDRQDFNVIGLGSELVDYDPSYKNIIENLLGKTVVVDTMENGISLSNKYRNSLRIVTLKGNLINPGGSMTGGSQAQAGTSLLGRKNQIERLAESIEKAGKSRDALSLQREKLIGELDHINRAGLGLVDQLKALELEKMSLDSQAKALANNISRLETGQATYRTELFQLEESNQQFLGKQTNLEGEILALEEELQATKNKVSSQTEQLSQLNLSREEESHKLTENKIYINREENLLGNLLDLEKDLQARLFSLKDQSRTISSQKEEGKRTYQEASLAIEDKKKLIGSEKIRLEANQALEKELEAAQTSQRASLESRQEGLRQILAAKEQLASKLNQLQLDKLKKDMELEAKEADLFEKYQLSYQEALAYQDPNMDLDQAASEIKKLRAIITRLGSVNLSSIEDYQALEERLSFINEQREDLLNAKLDLEKVIKKIEKNMKDKFRQEFEKINENFKEIFKILFNGGQASLSIQDENDILNSGIEINAMPPGKKLQNLSSLSGGERSLIAVSILFAILKIKPSPFCILDEIDAALDESNIERYTGYLREISHNTQFIIITHRKRTMEVADVLYGVTMEEEGVSKLISVELKDYEEEAS